MICDPEALFLPDFFALILSDAGTIPAATPLIAYSTMDIIGDRTLVTVNARKKVQEGRVECFGHRIQDDDAIFIYFIWRTLYQNGIHLVGLCFPHNGPYH